MGVLTIPSINYGSDKEKIAPFGEKAPVSHIGIYSSVFRREYLWLIRRRKEKSENKPRRNSGEDSERA